MSYTDPTNQELENYMPFKELDPIGTDSTPPTWQSVNDAISKLAANARSVPSNGGDGLLGHSFIIIGCSRYQALSVNNIIFVPPTQPTAGPIMLNKNPSYAQIEDAKRVYREDKWNYKMYHMVKDILQRMLLKAIHKNYKQQFWTNDFQYVCTLDQLLASLETYRIKTSKELLDNKSSMLKPWNVSSTETIHALICRVQDGRRFDPSIPEETCVRETVDIICANTGFGNAYETWSAKRPVDQTWANMTQHFVDADQTRLAMLALRPPSVITPYPGAANSTTTPGTNTTPPTESEKLHQAMSAMTKALNKLTSSSATTTTSTGNNGNNNRSRRSGGNPQEGGRVPTDEEATAMTYCWSHGFCVKGRNGQSDHTSASCERTHTGHKVDATAANKLGGECRICNSWKPGNRFNPITNT